MNVAKKLLIIDDEAQIRRLLRITMESYDWKIYEAEDGSHGISEAASIRPDCVILDLGLPDISGLHVLKRLREWSDVPVLILSVCDEPEEKVAALEAGADDYVTKPFESTELVARCRAIMRRRETRDETSIFSIGTFSMDYAAHSVSAEGKTVDLTATEYDLLRLLTLNAGKVLTHSYILRNIWGPKAEDQRQYLRVYIAAIRRKLEGYITIKTESRIGYRFISAK